MKNNKALECSFGAEASWHTLWGLPCGLLFDIEIYHQISVRKIKLRKLSFFSANSVCPIHFIYELVFSVIHSLVFIM